MQQLATLCCWLILSTAAADTLIVKPVDHWTVEFDCQRPSHKTRSLHARTTIVQPQGFTQVIDAPVQVADDRVRWRIAYPLVDDGRFDVQPGNWTGYWNMGAYRFKAELLEGENAIQTAEATFDPMSLCQRDYYGPIFSTYPWQFIECSPVRPAYIDADAMRFTIRTIPERVAHCTVVVDVTARNDEIVLQGPWTIELNGRPHEQTFDSANWPRGEYWIRVRLQKEGQPIGPYLIRKVWKELLPAVESDAVARRIARRKPVPASSFAADALRDARFVTDPLQKKPHRPLIVMDQPWETELLYYKTLHRDPVTNDFVLEYELAGGEKKRETERAQLPSTICRAISQDGLAWTKPSLGLATFRGSTDNNLVPADQRRLPPRPQKLPPSLKHDYDKATFRHYEAKKDGRVNLQNVFVTAVKESFPNLCGHESSHAFRTGAWPMEKRGDEYLALTREPILFVGVGMDLYHSTEKLTLHVEDKSTGTLYYFFRPGAPSYPPHHVPYDNMHMTRRCMGVMWTSDGLNWQRRLVAVPDEHDALGTQFYNVTAYNTDPESAFGRPAMSLEEHWNKVAVDGARFTIASLTIFDAKANQLWPELAAIDDLLHWRRFPLREKMIPNGPEGTYDYGLIKVESHYHEFDGEWWFPYQAINTLHQDYIGLARMADVEQFQREFPNYEQTPAFKSWSQFWERCKSMRYTTGMARCLPLRVCHIEPVGHFGTATTGPLILDGGTLSINAAAAPSGSVRAEVLDRSGTPIPGFEWRNCRPVTADSTDSEIAWENAALRAASGQEVFLRFHIDRAKLYSYQFK